MVRQLNHSDVGKTPAQSHDDDQDHGDRAETAERLSSRRLLPHFSGHGDSPYRFPYGFQRD
jgi:hypothetical protein